MSDPRSVIDRELERVDLRPFTIQAFHRRREQKRRRQRIAAGVVGVTVGLFAVLIGTSIVRSGPAPAPASPHPPPPAPRQAQLTFSDDAGIVAIDLASGRRHVRRPRRVGRRRLMVSGRLGPGVRIHDRAVLGRHPRHRDGRGSRPCQLRLVHALRRERRLVRGRRVDRVLDVIERRAGEPEQGDRLDPPRRNGGEAGYGYRRSPDRRRSVLVVARRFGGRLRRWSRDRRDERRRDGPPFVGERHVAGLVRRWFHDRFRPRSEPAALPTGPAAIRSSGSSGRSFRTARASRNFMAGRTAASVRGRQGRCGRLMVHRSPASP